MKLFHKDSGTAKEASGTKKNREPGHMLVRLLILAAELVFGILLLLDPERFAAVLLVAAAVIAAAVGVFKIIRYFRTPIRQAMAEHDFLDGTIYLLLALILVLCLRPEHSFVTVLSTLFCLIIAYLGLLKLQEGVNLLRRRVVFWYLTALAGLATIAAALIALVNPFGDMVPVWRFIAVALVILAAVDAVALLFTMVYLKKLKNGFDIAAAREERHRRAQQAEEKRKQKEAAAAAKAREEDETEESGQAGNEDLFAVKDDTNANTGKSLFHGETAAKPHAEASSDSQPESAGVQPEDSAASAFDDTDVSESAAMKEKPFSETADSDPSGHDVKGTEANVPGDDDFIDLDEKPSADETAADSTDSKAE